jgi:hypothetical protein
MAHFKRGAFHTARSMFDSPVWRHPVQHRIFEYIYGNAVFAKDGVLSKTGILVPYGSFLGAVRHIQKGTEWTERKRTRQFSLSTIHDALDALVKDQRLTKTLTDNGTLWHVTNYAAYQNLANYGQNKAERTCRTPQTAHGANKNGGGGDLSIEVPNGVAETVPNNNMYILKRIICTAGEILQENKIPFDPDTLANRMETWFTAYGKDALQAAFNKTVGVWSSHGKRGNFLSYLATVLQNAERNHDTE